jgi:Protein of unknown function (DUF3574)
MRHALLRRLRAAIWPTLRAASALTLALVLTDSANAQLLKCHGAQKPRQLAELIFGRKIGAGSQVSESQWLQFVEGDIAPRFPDGLMVIDAAGQWRDPASGILVREPSKIVRIVLPGRPEDLTRLDEIAAAYKRRFNQRSVGMILRPACASF